MGNLSSHKNQNCTGFCYKNKLLLSSKEFFRFRTLKGCLNMNRLELAINSFFWILLNKRFAKAVEQFFIKQPELPEKQELILKETKAPKKTSRSEALQLLALLQREGRLVDFLKEPIDTYNDAQIGAAVRDIHRDCAAVLDRAFSVVPLVENEEGTKLTVMPGFDPEQYKLTGNVTGTPPFKGTVRHHGWKVTKHELPVWNGRDESAEVIAPAEIEI
jgi:hypothetical protein